MPQTDQKISNPSSPNVHLVFVGCCYVYLPPVLFLPVQVAVIFRCQWGYNRTILRDYRPATSMTGGTPSTVEVLRRAPC